PQPVSVVRIFDIDWLHVESERPTSIDNILIGTRDNPFFRNDVVGQHPEMIERRGRNWACHHYFRNLLVGKASVVDIYKRPRPEIGIASDELGVFLRYLRASDRFRRHRLCPFWRWR